MYVCMDVCDVIVVPKEQPSLSSRRLIDTSSRDVEVVAMARHVWNDFETSVYTIPDQFSLQSYEDSGLVTIFFGSLIFIIFLILVLIETMRWNEANKLQKEKFKV